MKGERVAVVLYPVGPACTVQDDAGRVHWGYRVPDDYVPSGSHELVHRGRCVTVTTVGSCGTVVFGPDGRQTVGRRENGALRFTWMSDAKDPHDELEDAEPPELR